MSRVTHYYAFTHVYGYGCGKHDTNCLMVMSYIPLISIIAGIVMLSHQNRHITNHSRQVRAAYICRAVIDLTGFLGILLLPVDLLGTSMKSCGRLKHIRS